MPRPAVAFVVLLLVCGLLAASASAQENGEDTPTEPAGSETQPPRARAPAVALREVASGLAVPVFLTEADDGSDRLFVVDQVGHVRVVQDGRLLDRPFLDLSDRIVELDEGYDERGLLGLAFHPGYAENGRFFVYYSAPLRDAAPDGWDHTSHVSEFRVSEDDPGLADLEGERILLQVDQPFGNHNAGHIVFGQDGYLYIPLGDGGNGGDRDPEGDGRGRPEGGNAQTITTLLGSVLRIDVDGEEPYGIPEDNPFVDDDGRDEIFAYGFRNPYGLSVDRETGDLYAADAGQALYEEANVVRRGGNYGWNIKEGTRCFDPDNFVDSPDSCPDEGPRGEPLVDPVVEYRRGPETGSVIVAGVRYRGSRLDGFQGHFVFGDYGAIRFRPTGILYTAESRDEGLWQHRQVRIDTPLDGRSDGNLHRFVLGVSQDLEGELYLLTTESGGPAGSTGQVFALEPVDAAGESTWWRSVIPWLALGAAAAVLVAVAASWVARRRDAGRVVRSEP